MNVGKYIKLSLVFKGSLIFELIIQMKWKEILSQALPFLVRTYLRGHLEIPPVQLLKIDSECWFHLWSLLCVAFHFPKGLYCISSSINQVDSCFMLSSFHLRWRVCLSYLTNDGLSVPIIKTIPDGDSHSSMLHYITSAAVLMRTIPAYQYISRMVNIPSLHHLAFRQAIAICLIDASPRANQWWVLEDETCAGIKLTVYSHSP